MEHNLNFNTNKQAYAFASARELPWHRLGMIVKGAMTSAEAMDKALLNYEVDIKPTFIKLNDQELVVPDNFATYRTDNNVVFGSVGSRYEVVQNRDAFTFFDGIVGDGMAIYETAGALGRGETIFIVAKLPSSFKIKGDDIDQYLLLSSGHDGNSSIQILFTPIRVVCSNTLSMAAAQATNKVVFRHTKSVHDRLDMAAKVLGISNEMSEEAYGIFAKLAKIKITDDQAYEYFNQMFLTLPEQVLVKERDTTYDKIEEISTKKKNVITDIINYYHMGVGQSHIIGTAWGAYNAVTGYYQNVKKYADDTKKMKDISMEGTAFKKSNKAMYLAIRMEEL